MKNIILIIVLILAGTVCRADFWTRKADFPGGPRRDARVFAIGNKAYIGGGGLNDLWEYDPALDTFTQKNNPPFNASPWQLGFTIGDYGYVFTDSANEFWQYSPNDDMWTRKADLPGEIRRFPAVFVIGDKAYLGGGMGSPTINVSFYCYEPITDVWTSIAAIPHFFEEAVGFTANDNGYITSILDYGSLVYKYNPISDSWTRMANFSGTSRFEGASFTIENFGYYGTGDVGHGGEFKDWWQYDAINDLWISKAPIPCAVGKDEDPTCVINNKGYIFFGQDISPSAEIWEYTPDSITEVKQIPNTSLEISLYPSPASTTLTISSPKIISQIDIANLLCQTLFTCNYKSDQVQIDVSTLPPGIYFIKINNTEVRKFIKE